MKNVWKYLNSWQHFGTIGMVSKAWEKFIIDKHRFRSNIQRSVPEFPERETKEKQKPQDICIDKNLSICYLIHYFFPDKNGGTERFVLNIAKEQQRLGNNVRVITLGKRELNEYSNREKNIYWENFEFKGIPVTQIRYHRAPRGLYYDSIDDNEPNMRSFAELYLKDNRFDVVHAAYAQPFATFLNVCSEKKIPYMVTLTDFCLLCHYATMVDKRGDFCSGSERGRKCSKACPTYGLKDSKNRYTLAKKLLNGAKHITVPSEFVAKIIENEFTVACVEVIPHGISDVFKNKNIRTSTKKFVYAGTLSDLKGVELLIRTFSCLKGNDLTLNIYGEGESTYVSRLKKVASVDSRIAFCGEVSEEDIAQAYQEADCIVVPSVWFETYNFVLREALACGCLAIASNMGAMPEAVMVGKNGYIFEAGNEESLHDVLEKAKNFNWKEYEQFVFPQIKEEGDKYNVIYHNIEQSGGCNA